jgi:hypothetical protein
MRRVALPKLLSLNDSGQLENDQELSGVRCPAVTARLTLVRTGPRQGGGERTSARNTIRRHIVRNITHRTININVYIVCMWSFAPQFTSLAPEKL